MFIESSPGNDNWCVGTLLDTRISKASKPAQFVVTKEILVMAKYGLPARGQSSVLIWAIMRDLEKARANRRERGEPSRIRGLEKDTGKTGHSRGRVLSEQE